MFVQHRFRLWQSTKDYLFSLTPKFGYNGYGEFLFYRTYSRVKRDGSQENWADCIIRVVEGTFSIRKDWYIKTGVEWDEDEWQEYARGFAEYMFWMYWMPPGRGLWAMGSDFVYQRGGMALNNCGYTNITDNFSDDFAWMMDALMLGVGVGFGPQRNDKMELYSPKGEYDFIIPDSREGWVESIRQRLYAYQLPGQRKPRCIYDQIRPHGAIIHGFGGVASGPEPLIRLHQQIEEEAGKFRQLKHYDSIMFKGNIGNMLGCCVVAGNVRRSAELLAVSIQDRTFMELKNYDKYPERQPYGWMSNNSAILRNDEDYLKLGDVAKRVIERGEPGILNQKNFKYGRLGKFNDVYRVDFAVAVNPCGEITLEHRELCNICETCPTVCPDMQHWYKACEYATFYCTTTSLLPTHQPSTNRVVARNRRIGVGIIDIAKWKKDSGVYRVTRFLRKGYDVVRGTADRLNAEAGVPSPIRYTTLKPGGTTPKLPGKLSAFYHPNFRYMLRRTRVAENGPIDRILAKSNLPREKDLVSANTVIYHYPIHNSDVKEASQVPLWEQAMNLVWLQSEWADNAVSNTLNFRPMWPRIKIIKEDFIDEITEYVETDIAKVGLAKDLIDEGRDIYQSETHRLIFNYNPSNKKLIEIHIHEFDPSHEEDDIEPVLSMVVPRCKSLSLLPHSYKGAYEQMPEEGITRAEYEDMVSRLEPIDWSQLRGSDGEDERYCSGPACELPR